MGETDKPFRSDLLARLDAAMESQVPETRRLDDGAALSSETPAKIPRTGDAPSDPSAHRNLADNQSGGSGNNSGGQGIITPEQLHDMFNKMAEMMKTMAQMTASVHASNETQTRALVAAAESVQASAQNQTKPTANDEQSKKKEKKMLPKPMITEMGKVLRQCERSLYNYVKAKSRKASVDKEVEDHFSKQSYPKTVKEFSPPIYPEISIANPDAVDDNHKVEISIPKGATVEESMVIIHREAFHEIRKLEAQALETRAANLLAKAKKDKFFELVKAINRNDVMVAAGLADVADYNEENIIDRAEIMWQQMWTTARKNFEKKEAEAAEKERKDKDNAQQLQHSNPQKLLKEWMREEIKDCIIKPYEEPMTPADAKLAARRKEEHERKESEKLDKAAEEQSAKFITHINTCGQYSSKNELSPLGQRGQNPTGSPQKGAYSHDSKGKGKGKGKHKGKGKGKRYGTTMDKSKSKGKGLKGKHKKTGKGGKTGGK